MPADEKSSLLLRLYEEVINSGNLDVLDELYGEGYVNHAAPFGLSTDLEGLRKLFEEFVQAFPDQHIVADELFTHNDLVVGRWTLRATHKGTFFGIPATNRKIVMTGIDIERIENGRIVEHWGGEDMLGVLQQIGAVSLPGAGDSNAPS